MAFCGVKVGNSLMAAQRLCGTPGSRLIFQTWINILFLISVKISLSPKALDHSLMNCMICKVIQTLAT
jgi:hypothetical protein